MRTSRYLLATVKEAPNDAEILSHQLMIRAGLIRRVAAGIYSWLPLGFRVLKKVENIVRDEMDTSGAQEILMPGVHPAELWRESGRWEKYGPELLRLNDRHGREFCLGPTHEEVVTDIVRSEVQSYRQLPANLYQIQWKFRDEIRPRFGVMRGREFLMKDAYSFDIDAEGMAESYRVMYEAYERIFTRLGLETRAVAADSGAIGGDHSHEFHVLADSGEDAIAVSTTDNTAANIEVVQVPSPDGERPAPGVDMASVDTPGVHTINDLCKALNVEPDRTIKTLIVRGVDGPVALVIRGDHELNAVKAEHLEQVIKPLEFASAEEVKAASGTDPGSVGPVGLKIPVIVDAWASVMSDFVAGANEANKHLTGVNWERDVSGHTVADLRMITEGEPFVTSSGTHGNVELRRGIEVGHVFQLGLTYSKALNAEVLTDKGKTTPVYMGCYGIGVSRIVAASIEQNHDENGIVWPEAIAPFDVCIVPIGMKKSEAVRAACEKLYEDLKANGFDVLFDDRDERPGVMFSDMELIGVPHRVVIGDRGLKENRYEYRGRNKSENEDVDADTIIDFLKSRRGTIL